MARSPMIRIVLPFIGLDLLFTSLLSYAFLIMMGLEDAGTGTSLVLLVGLWLVKVIGWVVITRARLRPLARWAASPQSASDARTIVDMAMAAYRAPFNISLSWSSLFGGIALVHTVILYTAFADTVPLGPRSLEAIVFVSLGTFIGAEALAFPLAEWLMAPIIERVSLAAHERGVTIPGRGLSFRARLVAFSLTIALAPSLYLGGITYMNDARASQQELIRQAELAAAEAALGHPEAARAVDGSLFTFDAAGASVAGQDAAQALAARPVLARLLERAASAAPAGAVAHPR